MDLSDVFRACPKGQGCSSELPAGEVISECHGQLRANLASQTGTQGLPDYRSARYVYMLALHKYTSVCRVRYTYIIYRETTTQLLEAP